MGIGGALDVVFVLFLESVPYAVERMNCIVRCVASWTITRGFLFFFLLLPADILQAMNAGAFAVAIKGRALEGPTKYM